MSVVNVKVKYIRPDYDNLEEWMNDDSHVYVGASPNHAMVMFF